MQKHRSYIDVRMSTHRRFILMTLLPTLQGTVKRFLSSTPIVGQENPLSVLTFTVYPDLARLWYACWQKVGRGEIPIVIVDSCGALRDEFFPKATVWRFVNRYHSWKATLFIRKWVLSDYVWLMDDDQFILDCAAIKFVREEIAKQVAAISLLPRHSWSFQIRGQTIRPLGSFCIILNRSVMKAEDLSLAPVLVPNPHRPGAVYDSVDWANQWLIERGYQLVVNGDHKWIGGFYAASSGRINTVCFTAAELKRMITFPESTPEKVWLDLVQGLYVVHTIANLYRETFGMLPETRPHFDGTQLRELMTQAHSIHQKVKDDLVARFCSYDQVAQSVLSHLTS